MLDKFYVMDNNNYNLHNEGNSDEIKEMLSCPCRRILSNPCSLGCGHTMCKNCLVRNKYICQTCGEPSNFSEDNISVNVLIHSILAKLYPKHCEIEKLKTSAKEREDEGDLEKAIEELTLAKCIDDKNVTVLYQRSSLLCKKKLYQEARNDAETAVDLDPTNGYSHFCLGTALAGLKLMDEAIESYQNCLEYSFDDIELCDAVSNQMEVLLSGDLDEITDSDETFTAQKRKRSSNEDTSSIGKSKKKLPHQTLEKKLVSIDDVRCSLCLEILFRPVTTVCGHSFCKSCLMRSLDYQAICPNCRAPLREIVASQSIDVTTVIEDFLSQHFPEQYSQMQKSYQEKQSLLSKVGSDDKVEVPILVCMVALPSIPCPLNIFEPKYRGMLRECIESGSKRFGACGPTAGGHADTGTILKVIDVKYSNDGKALVTTVGENRFKIVKTVTREDGLMSAFVDYITDDWQQIDIKDVSKVEETCKNVYENLRKYFMSLKPEAKECIRRALGDMPELEVNVSGNPNAVSWLWWAIAALPLHESLKIRFLKSNSFPDRLGSIDRYLQSLLKRTALN